MSNDVMSQEDIEKLLMGAGVMDDSPDDAQSVASGSDVLARSANMNADDIDAMFRQNMAEPEADLNGGVMNVDDIDAMFNSVAQEPPRPLTQRELADEIDLDKLVLDADDNIDVNLYLSETDRDILGEIGNICMGTSATALYDLLDHKVNITTPTVSIKTKKTLMREYPMPLVCVGVQYTEGIDGDNVLLLKEYDVALITNLLLGGDGTIDPDDVEMDEIHLSAIREVMNQLVGSSATSMATLLNRSVNISTPVSKRIIIENDSLDDIISGDIFVSIGFKMEIENLLTSQIMQIWPLKFAKLICQIVMGEFEEDEFPAIDNTPVSRPAPAQAPAPTPSAPPQQYQQPQANMQQQGGQYQQPPAQQPPQYGQQPQYGQPPQQFGQPPQQQYDAQYQQPMGQMPPPGYPPQPQYPPYYQQPGPDGQPYPPYGYNAYQQPYPPYGQPPYGYPGQMQEDPRYAEQKQAKPQPRPKSVVSGGSSSVQDVIYPSFGSDMTGIEHNENFELIRKIPVEVSVVLGKKRLKIREVLDFNIGTVVVLDKLAGEPVDVLVNGTLVTRGEVVVVDENYGVRITEIYTQNLLESL